MKHVETVLNAASQLQRDTLAKLLPEEKFKKSIPASTEKLIEAIRWAHDSSLWGAVGAGKKSYLEILHSVARHLEIKLSSDEISHELAVLIGIKISDENGVEQLEQRICQKVLSDILEKLSPSQREAFTAVIQKESAKNSSGKSLLGVGGVAAALTAGKLGGFSTYILASSGLAAVSGAAGITLPFAAYTGLSTALGAALGPVGWISLGIFAIFSGGSSYDKLIPAILYISMLRNEPKGIASDKNLS